MDFAVQAYAVYDAGVPIAVGGLMSGNIVVGAWVARAVLPVCGGAS